MLSISLPVFGLTACLAAAGDPPPPPRHSVATVNDPRSHGTLGDGLLSLVEVMELNMGRLTENQLSTAEKAQLSGFGTDIAWADIDASKVPVLTLERDLPLIEETVHGLVIAGSNGTPILDIGSTKGFVARSNFLDFRNVKLRGGAVAISITQYDGIYGSVLEKVVFEGQSVAALRMTFQNDQGKTGGEGRLQIDDCVFPAIPEPVRVVSLDPNRNDTLIVTRSKFYGNSTTTPQFGLRIELGDGGRLVSTLERLDIHDVSHGIEIVHRNATDQRRILMDTAGVRMRNVVTGISYRGHATANSAINLRMLDIDASQQSVLVRDAGASATGSLATVQVEDSRLRGTVQVFGGSGAVTLANLRATAAKIGVGASSGAVRIVDSIFDRSTITTSGTSPVTIDACRFAAGSVTGAPQAPVRVTSSYLGGVTFGPAATSNSTLAAPQLGSMDAAPLDPKIGTSLTLTPDLPSRLSGIWIVGEVARQPLILARPLHLYFDQYFYVALPTVSRGVTPVVLPIPSNPYLIGLELAIQLVVVPDAGFPAPALSLPPGRFVRFRG